MSRESEAIKVLNEAYSRYIKMERDLAKNLNIVSDALSG